MDKNFKDKLIQDLDKFTNKKGQQELNTDGVVNVKKTTEIIEKKITKTIMEDGRQILKS